MARSLYSSSFVENVRDRITLSEVIGKRVNLKRRGNSIVGLCPFHNEKTPSFNVRDDKGFYHCFGCGAHGSVFDFLMKTENLTFPEALERAATIAGIPMPVEDPKQLKERYYLEAKKAPLFKALEEASNIYRQNLLNSRRLKDYISNRHIKEKTLEAFYIGYADSSKDTLLHIAKKENFDVSVFVKSGLLGKDQYENKLYPRFKERLIFPIHDLKGKVVGFGGRSISDDKHPKYLNSPDSEIFHKGKLLYGLYQAKQGWPAAQLPSNNIEKTTNRLIIVEGYMDVIALQQAGFSAVAPLGTSLTEDQLSIAWRHTKKPVLCFDGDTAGQKASFRALERALPLLKPGYTLDFITLPSGEDPDSLISRGQKNLFHSLVESAKPLVDVWWEKLVADATIKTPEDRAYFEYFVQKEVEKITDTSVRNKYHIEYRQRLFTLLRKTSSPGRKKQNKNIIPTLSNIPKDTQACLLLATLLNHPLLIEQIEHEILHLPLTGQLRNFHSALLEEISHTSPLDSKVLYSNLKNKGFDKLIEKLSNLEVYELAPFAHPDVTIEAALSGWRSLWKIFAEEKGLDQEIAVLANELKENPSSETWEKLKRLNEIKQSNKESSSDS